MNTVQSAWEEYEREAQPVAIELERLREKQAFYRGALAILDLLERLDRDGVSDAAASAMLTNVDEECQTVAGEASMHGAA